MPLKFDDYNGLRDFLLNNSIEVDQIEEDNAKTQLAEIRAERLALEKEKLAHKKRVDEERLALLREKERNAEQRRRAAEDRAFTKSAVIWFGVILEAIACLVFISIMAASLIK